MKKDLNLPLVFEQKFSVVMKITKEVDDLYDCGLKNHFFIYMFKNGYVEKVLKDEKLSLYDKLEFAALSLSRLK